MRTDRNAALTFVLVLALVSTNIFLVDASESDAVADNRIDVSYSHGQLIDVATGLEYNGGEFTNKLVLKFIPNRGYEFISWCILGSAEYSSDINQITITAVQGSISISVVVRNYSTSQELINIVDVDDLPVPGEELVLAWSFKSGSLDMSGGIWKGMPCTPLIVGDNAYIRAGGRLYQIDISSGSVIKQVISGTGESYYHYLSYGNGVIFDTLGHIAYDLDLNYLYDLPSNLSFATYHEGYFYGCLSQGNSYYTMYKTSLDVNHDLVDGVKVNLFNSTEQFKIFAQYGQFSNVLFVDDWFFFLQARTDDGGPGYRAISAFNVKTEASSTSVLNGFEGMLWDDGWLTYYDGYFYLTAYVAGLFGGVPSESVEKRSSLMWVKFDFENGRFEEPSYKKIQTPSGQDFYSIASGLVIFNGRGYLNVRALGTDTLGGSDDTGTCMIAYDIEQNGEPVPKYATPSAMTHGGIVVNRAHADEGIINVYMIPYNSAGQAIYVFTDQLVDGKWVFKSTVDTLEMKRTDWCSQCIRAGPNGEMLFYVDSGYIDCYVPADKYQVNVLTVDGEYATSRVECGRNVQEVIKKIYPTIEINGKSATLGDKQYLIYGLNEVSNKWVLVTNPSVGSYSGIYKNGITESTFRQIVLLEQNSSMSLAEDGEKGWYYFDGQYKKASFSDKTSLRESAGCSWFYLDSKPSDDSALIEPVKQVNRDDTVTLNLPELVTSTYDVSDDSIISVVREGNALNITGLKEKTSQITITIEGKQYVVSVNVLPKIEHTLDGKTITTSDREETTADGGIIHTLSVTTESESGMERTVTVTVKDSSENVISERVSGEKRTKGLTLDGKESDDVRISERLTENGVVTVDTLYSSVTVTTRVDIGVIAVSIIESMMDNLAGTNDITYTERTEYSSYNVSTVRVEHYDGVSETPTVDPTQTVYDSKQNDFAIDRQGDSIIIDLDENGSVDVSGLIAMAVDDSSVNGIVINAGAIVNAKSVTSAADAGASMAMDTGSVTISMGSDTLKNLAVAGGNVKFSAESGAKMTAKQQFAVGDAKVFTINLTCGDVEQHDFGAFRLSVTCDITLQDGKELKAWRIDDYGKKTYATNVTYQDGVVSFDADHLSIYAIGYESESSEDPSDSGNNGGGNNGMFLYAGIGAIAVLALLGAVFVMRRRA